MLGEAVVEAVWDPELTAAMRALGVEVQEESALELLLRDLERDFHSSSSRHDKLSDPCGTMPSRRSCT
ncbi:DUF2399 domain-containing protein [Actinomadura macrotermitis]|uniref:DUF2399 domain-containing protein n=1 Tax=Actinomadura macrotermitis TaxID=2585200 RepID=UPI001A9AC354